MLTKSKGFTENINLVVNNAIDLQGEITDDKNGKGRKFTSRFIESGIAHYKNLGDVLITKETLDKFIDTMVGCPVIINHKDITDKNADSERVGVVSNVWYNENDGWYYCDGIIWDKDAISLIKNNGWNVSCSYDFKSDFESKTHNGKKIDMEFVDGTFLHLALVETPRYERANIVVNSKDVQNGGEGSGDFDHAGRPGEVGGSEPAGTGRKGKYDDNKQTHLFDKDHIIKKEQRKILVDAREKLKDIKEFRKAYLDYFESSDEDIEHKYIEQGKKVEKLFENTNIKTDDFDDKEKEENLKIIDKKIKELEETIRANNSIERKDKIVMTALNDLENFVRNIVNNSCKEKDEMKVENEDKRKLIDEIGGILKGKVDEEIIRTIIGKAEKLAYEKSEDGTADNKCKNAKEEKEEKYKEEKEIAENEEIEVEEEELEEDAENCGKKVENSAETEEDLTNTIAKARNIVYNGNSKAESSYITRKDRLELGNNY